MTATGIPAAGPGGVLRLTWVRDRLSHVLEHCDTDEPSGTWTGLACPDHGLALGTDAGTATARQLASRGPACRPALGSFRRPGRRACDAGSGAKPTWPPRSLAPCGLRTCPRRPDRRGHAPWRSCGIFMTTCGGRSRWRSLARCWPNSGATPNCSPPSAAASSSRAGRCCAMRWPTPSRPASYRSPQTRKYSPACSSAPSTPATWLPPSSRMTGQSGRCGKLGQTTDRPLSRPHRLRRSHSRAGSFPSVARDAICWCRQARCPA